MRSIPRFIVVMLTLCCCVGCDQVSKSAARSLLHSGVTESLFADSLRFQLTENPGSFLSLGASLPEQFALHAVYGGGRSQFWPGWCARRCSPGVLAPRDLSRSRWSREAESAT